MSELDMFRHIQRCDKWLKCPITIEGYSGKFNAEIILEDASLSFAYLAISDRVYTHLCTPISSLIEQKFTEYDLCLQFHGYGETKILLHFEDSHDLELFTAQINICASLSQNIPDLFFESNCSFVNLISLNDENRLNGMPNFPQQCSVILPIDTHKYSRKTWMKRNRIINSAFFSRETQLNIAFLTYNVAQRQPSSSLEEDLTELFQKEERIDALFVTFQEIDFGAIALVVGSSSAKDAWTDTLRGVFRHAGEEFALVRSSSIGGVYSALFARPRFSEFFAAEEPTTVKLGVGGVMANKSAVIMPLHAAECSITVIAAHLAPHLKNNAERLSQIDILLKSAPKSDHTVLLGDLNFRNLLSYERGIELARNGDFEGLLETDQLRAALSFTDHLPRFAEAEISFEPTFRLDVGSDLFDTSQKRRPPAYTDRVLVSSAEPRFAAGPTDTLAFETDVVRELSGTAFRTEEQFSLARPAPTHPKPALPLSYRRLSTRFSDHRPVAALWAFAVPVVDQAREDSFRAAARAKREDAAALRVPSLSARRLDGKRLMLTNNGCCWARWEAETENAELAARKGSVFVGCEAPLEFRIGDPTKPAKAIFHLEGGSDEEIILSEELSDL